MMYGKSETPNLKLETSSKFETFKCAQVWQFGDLGFVSSLRFQISNLAALVETDNHFPIIGFILFIRPTCDGGNV